MSRLSRIGLPLSNDSITAKSRACFCIMRAMAYRTLARAGPPDASHAGWAALAHFTATATSLADVSVIPAIFSPVAGL